MLAFTVNDTKSFMNLLLKGDTFDAFSFRQGELTTFASFLIEGKRNMDFYTAEEQEAGLSRYLSRVKVDPSEPKHYFLNIALNTAKGVGFIADTNTADVLVVQLDSGKIVHRVPTPNSIAAVYNPARNEVYVTHRNARQISVIDANTYSLKHTIKTAAMPNSMVLSPDSKTLFVSVKQDEKANKADYVLKLDLTQF